MKEAPFTLLATVILCAVAESFRFTGKTMHSHAGAWERDIFCSVQNDAGGFRSVRNDGCFFIPCTMTLIVLSGGCASLIHPTPFRVF